VLARPWRIGLPVLAMLLLAAPHAADADAESAGAQSQQEQQERNAVIQEGSKVTLEYTLKLGDGQVVDTSEGREPFVYQHGAGQILPALEEELAGLSAGTEKELTLAPEQGYGPVNDELFQAVPADQIPEAARHEGAQLVSRDQQGNERPLRVHEVREEEIVLDLNHPLAGESLHFDVKVVSVD
jgi:FKBP-type peptidyl-prolyl cis-trans isomerase 2